MKINRKLIDDLAEAEHTRQRYYQDDPPRPQPGPPATDDALARLELHLRKNGVPFPAAYRAFLAVADGVKDFDLNFSLLSADEVRKPPLESLQRRYPSLSKFIIGRSNGLEFMAFDPDTAKKDDMEVVWVADDGQEARYENFAAFLTKRLDRLHAEIKREKADRTKATRKKSKR